MLLRGEGGVFSTGADMGNAYTWYERRRRQRRQRRWRGRPRRPSQRRRLAVDRKTFDFYHELLGYPKVTVAEVRGYALGGGFELALMADIAVVAATRMVGMPATRFLGPALGSLHMFFHRLGPVLARRLLLTGDTVDGVDARAPRRVHRGRRRRRRRGPGRVVGREDRRACRPTASSWPRRPSASSSSCRRTRARRSLSYLFHAYGTNLQFDEGEFNFVKVRAEHGTKRAFELRDEHFEVPEP